MTTTTTVRVGSLWKRGDRTVMVLWLDGACAQVQPVVDGKLSGRQSWVTMPDSRLQGYTFDRQVPTLRCVNETAAAEALAFLRGKGITSAWAFGQDVVVSMTPPSVIMFAEDALENGWAHDEDCARMIGDLG